MAQVHRGHRHGSLAADWRPAVAGVLGGSVSTLLLHPLDLLKTRQAVHCNGESKAARTAYASVATAVRHIVRQEGGARALYRGVGTNVAVAGTSWGLTFMRYVGYKHKRECKLFKSTHEIRNGLLDWGSQLNKFDSSFSVTVL